MTENEKIAREVLVATCDTDEILEDYDLDLVDAGFIDSFAVLTAILEIEKRTGLKLQATDIKKSDVSSINNLIRFLDAKR
ncbi:MAG: D-alanine--poly(phosphoribitol) ligase subunit 2 [Desulfovibrio desulfuricans]|jgi:D-alanine--poly(phosphoribitol) ligase subunit 2|nr:D-alanine--poly(phosphoribitol) ligase subunit 2 [Desulfovibrio desulfuricans]